MALTQQTASLVSPENSAGSATLILAVLVVVVTRVDRLTSRSRVTYSEGGTREETLHPQSKAKVMNKR